MSTDDIHADRVAEPTGTNESGSLDGAPSIVPSAVLVLSWAPALGSLAFWAVDRPSWSLDIWFVVVDVMVAIVYGSVSFVLLRRTRHPAAWVLAVAAIGGGWAAFGAMYQAHGLGGDPLPAWETIGSMAGWAWVPGTLALVVVLPWLVRREELGRGARSMVVIGTALCLIITAVRLTNPAPWPDGDPFMPLGIRSRSWARLSDQLIPWLFVVVVALGAVASIDVTRRQSDRDDPRRRSLRWLAVGTWAMTLSFVPLTFPGGWFDNTVAVPASTPVLHLMAQAFLPAATLVAVLRQRLWGVDLVVSRTLPWGVLSGVLAIVYAVTAATIGAAVDDDGVSIALAAAAVGALVAPGHRWLQRRVDLLVYGEGSDALRSVREVGRVIGTTPSGDSTALLGDVLSSMMTSMRLMWVDVSVRMDGAERSICSLGTPSARHETFVLEHRRRAVGVLRAGLPEGERFDARTRRSLADLVPIIAAVVTLVRLNDELVQARRRLTTARLEERRLVRRDLHDGLGPALAGIGLGLRASRNLMATEPSRAARLLDELAEEMEHRVADVRELSRALLPPVLDELGLLAAVHDLAARLRHDGLQVTIDASGTGELSPDVATAAFAVVSEAAMNARRHASARRLRITLGCPGRGDELVVVVDDDGGGWTRSTTAGAGVGLTSMRERAVELGGDLELGDSDLGGARVTWRVPCETGGDHRRHRREGAGR